MSKRNLKIPRVPKVPDILFPKPVKFDKESKLEIIIGRKQSIKGPKYVYDLGIGDMLQKSTDLSIPEWSKEKKEEDHRLVIRARLRLNDFEVDRRTELTQSIVSRTIEKIFTVPSDQDTANYRLDVFDYLLSNQKGFENFSRVFKNLNSLVVQGIQREKHSREEDVWTLIANYGLIFDITEHYVPFGEDAPEALRKMDKYFEALKKSYSHKKMGELASKLSEPHDINLRIRVDPAQNHERYPWVVSASVIRASEFVGEFGDGFKLDDRYHLHSHLGDKDVVKEILGKAIELKYERHLRDTEGHVGATLSLFEPMLIYMGYINFMKQQQKRGVEFCRPKFSDKGVILNAKNSLVVTEPIVGNDIIYNREDVVRVITGPNNGGKTVYIKTVGMIHALAQRGFYVPASTAELKFIDNIYTHFISPEDIANAEGRYQNEMRRMDEIFSAVTSNSLVILDEPCGGTTLESSEKVTRDFLRAFGRLGNLTYLTTHMSGLAEAVKSDNMPRSRNLHMHMEEDGRPTYQLREGISPMHYGEFIPKKMGLDYDNLSRRLSKRAVEEGFSFNE